MKKDEFLTAFNALFTSEQPDPLAIESLRSSVLADYDALSTAQTAVQSFTTTNENLTKENNTLRETNMRLIMLHPESINLDKHNKDSDNSDQEGETKELTAAEKDAALDEVLKGFGHKAKEE